MRKVLLGLLVVLSLVSNAQLGIGYTSVEVKDMLETDTTVTDRKMGEYLTDNDGTEYFSYTAISRKTLLFYKFIVLNQKWTCVRQVYAFAGDNRFDEIWTYLSTKVCTTMDSETSGHYYEEGIKFSIYWTYDKTSRSYMIIYDMNYKVK